MKLTKQIMIIILLFVSYNNAMAQNLDRLPQPKRDSILISIAKEVILKYGPDYYREYAKPIIKRSNTDRAAYEVTFLYDKTEETLEWDYAAKVFIWADTGNPGSVFFGNGFGRGIPEGREWLTDTTISPVPYQESVVPLYDINNHDPNQEPVNKDELIRKGWEKRGDRGEWVKTRPDVPPQRWRGGDRR